MATILVTVRNKDNAFTYSDLRPMLLDLAQLCYSLGLDDRRSTMESMMHRGDGLIKEGFKDYHVLQIFTDWVPTPRFQRAAALKAHDRSQMLALFKARGGSSSTALMMAVQSAAQGRGAGPLLSSPTPAAPPATPYFSTQPPVHTPAAPSALQLGSLTLPLPSAGQAALQKLQPASRGGGRAGSGRGKRAGKGQTASPGTPTPQAAQERVAYNKQLKALQHAALPHPAGYKCPACVAQGRTPHHQPHECAYSECDNCSRGGHKAKRCTFPKYP